MHEGDTAGLDLPWGVGVEQSATKTRFWVYGYDKRRALRSGGTMFVGLYGFLLLALYPSHGGWAWEYVTGFTVTYTALLTLGRRVMPTRIDVANSTINYKPSIGPFRRTLQTESIRHITVERKLFLGSCVVAVLQDYREVKILSDVMPDQAAAVAHELERLTGRRASG